ncbi:hypothetical protein PVAND_012458 [Polypedilum vanderplanki]|uniref:Uncharacterized protein n=1 Tax=Polypedilum vanderplanki TaxID=319348 RepID=A0A9J6CLN9_POLVA|nr:hypothetical protein PVAND_012458 [Polypedilum vanderplanki]
MERKVNYIKKDLIKGMEVKNLIIIFHLFLIHENFSILKHFLRKTENEILELFENFNQLLQNFQELTELRYVLERTQSFFSEHVSNYEESKAEEAELLEDLWGMVLNIGLTQSLYVGGAILFPIFGAWAF